MSTILKINKEVEKIIIPSEIQGIAGLTKTIAEVARTETSVAKEKEVK